MIRSAVRSARVFLPVAAAAFAAFHLTHSHLPLVWVSVVAAPVGPVAVGYDTGYGFNPDQSHDVPDPPPATVATAGPAVGPAELVLRFDGRPNGAARYDRGPQDIPADPAGVARTPVAARQRVAVVRVRDLRGLREVRVAAAGAAEAVVPLPEVRWAGPVPGAVVFDRTCDPPRVLVTAVHVQLWVDDLTGVRVGGVDAAAGGTAVVTVEGRGAVVVPLAPDGEGRLAARGIDVTGFRVRYHRVRTAIQLAVAAALGAAAVGLVRRRAAVGRWVVGRRGFFAWWGVYAAGLGVWAVGFWPGVFLCDSVEPARAAVSGEPNLWFTATYSACLIAVSQFGPVYHVLTVLQVAAAAALAAAVTTHLVRSGVSPWLVGGTVLAFAAVSPVVGCHAAEGQRGVLAALANLAAAGLLARAVLGRPGAGLPPLPPAGWVALAGLTLLAALVRKEGVLLAAAVVGVLLLARPVRRRWVLAGAAAAAGLYALATGPVERWAVGRDTRADHAEYQVIGFINPAGAVVARGGPGALTPEEAAAFARVVPPDVLAREWSPYRAPECYWAAVAAKPSPADVAAFRRAVVAACLRHPGLVLAARAETFAGLLGGPPEVLDMLPWTPGYYTPWIVRNSKDLRVWPADPPVPGLTRLLLRVMAATTDPAHPASRVWVVWPQLGLCLVAVARFRRRPATAAAAAVVLARTAGVFLTAPMAAFFYVFDLYLLGLAVPGLWAAEGRLTASPRCTTGACSPG